MSEGQNVYASATIYNASLGPRLFSLNIRFYDTASASTTGTQLPTSFSTGGVTIPAGGSAFMSISGTAPVDTLSAGVNVNRDSLSNAASGDIYYVDNVYFSNTPAGFADGTTPNWVWNGPANASTSTGPMVSL